MILLRPIFALAAAAFFASFAAGAENPPAPREAPAFYRALTMRLRQSGKFKIAMPGGHDLPVSFHFKLEKPFDAEAGLYDNDDVWHPGHYMRLFWDRIAASTDSVIRIGDEDLPMSCAKIYGHDNRYVSGHDALSPDYFIQVWIVANDFSCVGPKTPEPWRTGREETWDTFIYYEIKDPTIMLPTEPKVRYRWNEWRLVPDGSAT